MEQNKYLMVHRNCIQSKVLAQLELVIHHNRKQSKAQYQQFHQLMKVHNKYPMVQYYRFQSKDQKFLYQHYLLHQALMAHLARNQNQPAPMMELELKLMAIIYKKYLTLERLHRLIVIGQLEQVSKSLMKVQFKPMIYLKQHLPQLDQLTLMLKQANQLHRFRSSSNNLLSISKLVEACFCQQSLQLEMLIQLLKVQ